MKKAIFLRGHARTWNFIKKDTIKFFNDLYDNPDWYVAMWNTSTTTTEKLKKDFSDSKHVFISADIDENYVDDFFDKEIKCLGVKSKNFITFKENSYLKLAYLDFKLNLEKKKHELNDNFRYDFVSFIRPDNMYMCGMSPHYDKEFANSKLLTTALEGALSAQRWWLDDKSMANDFFMRAGNAASNLFCSRFFDITYTDEKDELFSRCPHNLLSKFISRNDLIDEYKCDIINYLIRPDFESHINNLSETRNNLENNILEIRNKLQNELKKVNDYTTFDCFKFAHNWGKLMSNKSKEIPILYCVKNGIDIQDYQIKTHNEEFYINLINLAKNYIPKNH